MPESSSTSFSCPRCSVAVRITKFSREHTLTRWPQGHKGCPELAEGPEHYGTGQCSFLTESVRKAFDNGAITQVTRAPGT